VLESGLILRSRPAGRASRKWEHGSNFHWLQFDPVPKRTPSPWPEPAVYTGSGRDALRCLLVHGIARRGWRRIWVPSYFCQEVVGSIASSGIDIRAYPDNPLLPTPVWPGALREGDVFLAVNYFGLRSRPRLPEIRGVEVIEDHTHDPWSDWAFHSSADYCVASLRKTLPIPDGGVLWSPRGNEVPATPALSPTRRAASAAGLAAMLLKRLYLEGHQVEKKLFLEMARHAERNIATGEISGMSPCSAATLPNLPAASWRDVRRRNHERLRGRLEAAPWSTVLASDGDGSCPFIVMTVCDTAARAEHIRRGLIAADVYPPVLWSLENSVVPDIPQSDRVLAARLVAVHCDMRYSDCDMDRVGTLIVELGNAWNG
jgi:hypothetical protein